MLHGLGISARAKRLKSFLALIAVETRRAYLDQLVRRERSVDFVHHFIRKAFVADEDHGLEVMSPRFEQFTLGWCQNVYLASLGFSPSYPPVVG